MKKKEPANSSVKEEKETTEGKLKVELGGEKGVVFVGCSKRLTSFYAERLTKPPFGSGRCEIVHGHSKTTRFGFLSYICIYTVILKKIAVRTEDQ